MTTYVVYRKPDGDVTYATMADVEYGPDETPLTIEQRVELMNLGDSEHVVAEDLPPLGFDQGYDIQNGQVIVVDLPPTPYTLYVEALWSRMTDEEAEDFDGAMTTATPLRLRKSFNAASALTSQTELFDFVHTVLAGATSTERADAIMART